MVTLVKAIAASVLLGGGLIPAFAMAAEGKQGPSFSCANVESGSIEAMVCSDPQLAAQDRQLAAVYGQAWTVADENGLATLRGEQRGWLKGRDDCWKSDDQRSCVSHSYQLRIAELQARYRLLKGDGPFIYECDGNPATKVVVIYFPTEPLTLIAERGDSAALMYLQSSVGEGHYQGRNESLTAYQGVTTIVWGDQAEPIHCTVAGH